LLARQLERVQRLAARLAIARQVEQPPVGPAQPRQRSGVDRQPLDARRARRIVAIERHRVDPDRVVEVERLLEVAERRAQVARRQEVDLPRARARDRRRRVVAHPVTERLAPAGREIVAIQPIELVVLGAGVDHRRAVRRPVVRLDRGVARAGDAHDRARGDVEHVDRLRLIGEHQLAPVGRPREAAAKPRAQPGQPAIGRAGRAHVDLVLAARVRHVRDALAVGRVHPAVLADPRRLRQVDDRPAVAGRLEQLAAPADQRARTVGRRVERAQPRRDRDRARRSLGQRAVDRDGQRVVAPGREVQHAQLVEQLVRDPPAAQARVPLVGGAVTRQLRERPRGHIVAVQVHAAQRQLRATPGRGSWRPR
jgi:hypothetical protein